MNASFAFVGFSTAFPVWSIVTQLFGFGVTEKVVEPVTF